MSRKVSHSSDFVGCFFDHRLDRLFFHDGLVSDVGFSVVFFSGENPNGVFWLSELSINEIRTEKTL